jgi:hypothetical protein
MKRLVLALLCALIPLTSYAQPSKQQAVVQPLPPQTAIKSDLDKIFDGLASQLKAADALVVQLKATAAKTPADTSAEVNNAAEVLSGLADKTRADGELAGQLSALRNAAVIHRKRVTDMAKGSIEETDRTNILSSWDKVTQEADEAQAAMVNMHQSLMGSLDKLRMRQVAVSELLLAGQYQAAVAALKGWLSELESTVAALHKAIDPVKSLVS